MNPYRKLLIFVLLCTMLISGCVSQVSAKNAQRSIFKTGIISQPTPTSKPITQMIAFGDDFVDTGNALRMTTTDVKNKVTNAFIFPVEPNWEGRWSNGPVVAEVMAQRLGVKLADYAVCGAQSGLTNIVPHGEFWLTGLISQVNLFEQELKGKKADPDALYLIFITTANDFWWFCSDPGDDYEGHSEDLADIVLKNVQKAVIKLAQLGAKRVLVVNPVDQTIMPHYVVNKDENLAVYQTRFRSRLPEVMTDLSKQLNIEIKVFDIQAVGDKIRANPQKYGLKNLNDPCMVDYWAKSACENPDEYYFWDPFHNTHRVQQIFGEELAAVYGK